MWHGKKIAVVVPAYNEARLIGRTISSIPDYVDEIHVVDDCSTDGTSEQASGASDGRLRCHRHDVNRGVGAAIVTGYRAALRHGADVMVVMAGDAQMDSADLPRLLAPIVAGQADYVKGNRFLHPERLRMPMTRRLAGKALSAMTRSATGIAIDDSQCGFTALSARCAAELPLEDLWPRYGYPNDLLGMLAEANALVTEAPVRPVYAGESSGVRPWHALTITYLIARRWVRTLRFGFMPKALVLRHARSIAARASGRSSDRALQR